MDVAWSYLRFRVGPPVGSRYGGGFRVAVSSEGGDEKVKLLVLPDRQRGLPKPVKLEKITDRLDLVKIPAGGFRMGSAMYYRKSKKKHPLYSECPEHMVRLSTFQIAKYETTRAQWKRVYDWALKHGYEFDHAGDKGRASSDDLRHPITGISWFDAVKWCNAASEMEGLQPCYYLDKAQKILYSISHCNSAVVDWTANGYRLPTEAEWEYAAIGGQDDTGYYWGDHPDAAYAWFAGWEGDSNTDYPILQDYLKTRPMGDIGEIAGQPKPKWASHPVGQKIGNHYGLYDTFGNVWELCWDRVAPYSMIFRDTLDPKGPESKEAIDAYLRSYTRDIMSVLPASIYSDKDGGVPPHGGLRALKGSSFAIGAKCNKYGLSLRSGVTPEDADDECGFRVARSLKKTK